MKSKSYGGPLSQREARAEVNRLVKDVKQDLRTISHLTGYSMTDLAELFVRNLLIRLGVPIDE